MEAYGFNPLWENRVNNQAGYVGLETGRYLFRTVRGQYGCWHEIRRIDDATNTVWMIGDNPI